MAADLEPICISLRNFYSSQKRELDSQPQEIELMKAQQLSHLNNELQEIGHNYYKHIEEEVNDIVTNENRDFERDFQALQTRFVNRLDELLQTF